MLSLRPLTFVVALSAGSLAGQLPARAETDLIRGEAVFKKCVACHEVERPRHKMGPHLNGLIGRTAGSLEGFKYSQAMRDTGQAGLKWDRDKLADFIASPKKAVPGTSMRFYGLWSESDIADLISYIESVPAKQE